MNLLSVENISKSFGERKLFDNISFGIEDGDRIGLIGINGTGKSTLLKALAGVEILDDGKIVKGNNVRIGYLPQNPDFNDEASVLQQVFDTDSPVMKLIMEYETTIELANMQPENKEVQDRVINLSSKIDEINGWEVESEAKNVLMQLGINDFNKKIKTLSGGQKKRVALASVLINPCEILILDEPTNHIDESMVTWLEEYLKRRKGSLLMVTHDRYFLDRIVNKMFELHRGELYSYDANYSKFLELKLMREEQLEASEMKRQNLMRRELEWIKRGAKARSTKQKARIQRFEELSNQEYKGISENVEISAASTRLGKKVIELKNISKAYGEHELINDFSFLFGNGDRVGIIGANGEGKSTLMNIISGNIEADKGIVDTGDTVKIGYFSQENVQMNGELRVIEYIKEQAEYVTTLDGEMISASKMLEKFLFDPKEQWTPIYKLSGGEKRRLYLLRVLMSSPNVLMLDEPTNDLDIQTMTVLEEYLETFSGTVITVSHDRYFLDRVVDELIVFEGNANISKFTGNFSEYIDKRVVTKASPISQHKANDTKEKIQQTQIDKETKLKLKMTYNEQKEFESIDSDIESLENKLTEINGKIDNAGSDFLLLQELTTKKQDTEKLIDEKMERWTYLNELADEIEKNKQGLKKN